MSGKVHDPRQCVMFAEQPVEHRPSECIDVVLTRSSASVGRKAMLSETQIDEGGEVPVYHWQERHLGRLIELRGRKAHVMVGTSNIFSSELVFPLFTTPTMTAGVASKAGVTGWHLDALTLLRLRKTYWNAKKNRSGT